MPPISINSRALPRRDSRAIQHRRPTQPGKTRSTSTRIEGCSRWPTLAGAHRPTRRPNRNTGANHPVLRGRRAPPAPTPHPGRIPRLHRGRGYPAAVRALRPGTGPVAGRDRRSAAHPRSSGAAVRLRDGAAQRPHRRVGDPNRGAVHTLRDELRARLAPGAIPDAASCRSDQICYLIEEDRANEDVPPS